MKDLVKQETKEVAVSGLELAEWGVSSISSEDLIIPRIKLMQPMAEEVTAGEAAFGELRSSLDNSKLADFKTGLEVIPIELFKQWVEYDVTFGEDIKSKKYLQTISVTTANLNLPFKEEVQGMKIARDLVMNFYVLLAKDVLLGGAIPHILSFRRSSITGGKKLATQMAKMIDAGKPPCTTTCLVTVHKTTVDTSTWAITDVSPNGLTSQEGIAAAFKWFKMIQKGKVKVDADVELSVPAKPPTFVEKVEATVSKVAQPIKNHAPQAKSAPNHEFGKAPYGSVKLNF